MGLLRDYLQTSICQMVASHVYLAIMDHRKWVFSSNMTNMESITSPIKETMCWKRKAIWMKKHLDNRMRPNPPPMYVFPSGEGVAKGWVPPRIDALERAWILLGPNMPLIGLPLGIKGLKIPRKWLILRVYMDLKGNKLPWPKIASYNFQDHTKEWKGSHSIDDNFL